LRQRSRCYSSKHCVINFSFALVRDLESGLNVIMKSEGRIVVFCFVLFSHE